MKRALPPVILAALLAACPNAKDERPEDGAAGTEAGDEATACEAELVRVKAELEECRAPEL